MGVRVSSAAEPLGWMVVAVRQSTYHGPGTFEYASAGSITTREAAENHRAYCEGDARARLAAWSESDEPVRYVVAAVTTSGGLDMSEMLDEPCDHGGNYLAGDNWHCLTCPHVWPVAGDPEGWGGFNA